MWRKMGTSNAFDFSPYGESLGKQCACSAKGLVKAKEFLKVLNKANPEITILKLGSTSGGYQIRGQNWQI